MLVRAAAYPSRYTAYGTFVDDASEHCKEVYAQSGLALYFAQCLEMEIHNFLLLMAQASRTVVTLEELDSYSDRIRKKTLGALIKKAKKMANIGDPADPEVDAALKTRNFLVHDFFKDRAAEFLSFKGREQMLHELNDMQNKFKIAETLILALNRAVMKVVGLTEEMLEEEFKKLKQKAEAV